ncbi:hypothetical protein Mapa_004386 [Marchantia paleacea]|nr:hypothetical protein Mapa_004386 [Marchantia paleacea]
MIAGTGIQTVESGRQDVLHDVQMDYYGKRLASCSSDRSIKLFAVCCRRIDHFGGPRRAVWDVALAHPKFGSIIALCSYNRKVIIWKEGVENEWS